MVNNVSGLPVTQPAAQSKSVDIKVTQSKPQQTPKDTVQVSTAAQAALKEATETQAQTVKEANSGDLQAKILLAKEAAERAAEK
ncbi:MAG: hypothetical protein M0Z61_07615 [Nitrospiraceae bacterium]|nr:hypothetical protein [Nitrospiraceae bacterium]